MPRQAVPCSLKYSFLIFKWYQMHGMPDAATSHHKLWVISLWPPVPLHSAPSLSLHRLIRCFNPSIHWTELRPAQRALNIKPTNWNRVRHHFIKTTSINWTNEEIISKSMNTHMNECYTSCGEKRSQRQLAEWHMTPTHERTEHGDSCCCSGGDRFPHLEPPNHRTKWRVPAETPPSATPRR